MKIKPFWLSAIALILSTQALVSCDQDPLNLSDRQIAGIYYLQRWEDGKTFYIVQKDHFNDDGGGVIDGTALVMGWNDKSIVVRRHAIFGGDPDGWMVIDLETNKIVGPLSDDVERKMFPSIQTMPASDAWIKLH